MTTTAPHPPTTPALPVLVDTPAGPLRPTPANRPPIAGALRATLVNDHDTPFTCTRLTVTIPVGDHAAALTTAPHHIQAHPPPGWTTRHDHPGTITATPSTPAELPAAATLTLTLEGILTNTTTGLARVQVQAEGHYHDAEPTQQITTHLIRKDAPPSPILSNFAPNPQAVTRGGQTQLTWAVRSGSNPRFALRAGTQEIEVSEKTGLKKTGDSYTFPYPVLTQNPYRGMTQNTAFLLTAYPVGGGPPDYAVTLVTVTQGDIDAGNLTVNGTARILSTPTPYVLTPDSPEKTIPVRTDGFLTASVSTGGNNDKASLDVKVCPHDNKPIFSYTLISDESAGTENMLVPVPADSTIDITLKGDYYPSGTVTWFPLGHDDGPQHSPGEHP